jgi:hypothetical protein
LIGGLALRKDIIAGLHTLIEAIVEREDAEICYVNFLFHDLPSGEAHCLLKRHVVRKPDAPRWRDLVPVLIGALDYPVVKRQKVDVRLLQVNGGLHFNAVVLLPPRFRPPRIAGERQSRLENSLVVHVQEKSAEYLTNKLYRIHITPMVKGTTMADYTFKAFKNGRIGSDDVLILN